MEFKTTTTELVKAVREAAAKNPENFAGCTYTQIVDGKLAPRCIVGQALYDLASEEEKPEVLEYLAPLKNENVKHLVSFSRHEFLEGNQFSDETRWLLTVQTAQDDGENWENAVSEGDARNPLGLSA